MRLIRRSRVTLFAGMLPFLFQGFIHFPSFAGERTLSSAPFRERDTVHLDPRAYCANLLQNKPDLVSVHFSTTFTLRPVGSASSSHVFEQIIEHFRDWIIEKYEISGLDQTDRDRWRKGSLGWSKDTVNIATQDVEEGETTYWSLLLQHDDLRGEYRWQSDFVVTHQSSAERVIISATVTSWPKPGFHGDLHQFSSAAPRVIRNILKGSADYSAFTGNGIGIRTTPIRLKTEDSSLLSKLLGESGGSRLPVVYVSRELSSGNALLDPNSLAQSLAGVAIVLVEDSLEVQSLVRQQYPERFRAWDGAIRIYLSNVDFSKTQDSYRHRYITRHDILSHSSEGLIEKIFQYVVNYNASDTTLNATNIRSSRDVLNLSLEMEQKELADFIAKSSVIDQAQVENLKGLISLYEEEVASLQARVKELSQQLANVTHTPADMIRMVRAENSLEERLRVFQALSLNDLPRTPSDVVKFFQKNFSDRLVFTDKALKSAEDTSFRDVSVAWRLLYSVLTTLHELYFQGRSQDIAQSFHDQTGFEIAMSESPSVRNSPRLRAMREDTYQGETIQFYSHIKFGNRAPKLLRVHYYVDRESQKIVIGHFGDHLENALTRFQ